MGSPLYVALRFETWEQLKVSNGFGEAPLSGPKGVTGVLLVVVDASELPDHSPNDPDCRVLVDTVKDIELGNDGGPIEDATFWRDWDWVAPALNELAEQVATLTRERDEARGALGAKRKSEAYVTEQAVALHEQVLELTKERDEARARVAELEASTQRHARQCASLLDELNDTPPADGSDDAPI